MPDRKSHSTKAGVAASSWQNVVVMLVKSLARFSLIAMLPACTLISLPVLQGDPPEPVFDYPLDDVLRLHHIQTKASHNSYHVARPDTTKTEYSYTHVPLDQQLQEQGVRHLELDLHYDWSAGQFQVFHVSLVDDGTNCPELKQCLSLIKTWSDAHRAHHPITVQLEIKDAVPSADLMEDYFAALHAAILSVWPQDRILTPEEVKGGYATLGEAIKTEGWPTLGKLRGHILFTLYNMEDAFGAAYTHNYMDLNDRLIFARVATPDEPYAATIVADDATNPVVPDGIAANLLVRSRADWDMIQPLANDTTRREITLASGAHFVATDIPAPVPGLDYWVDIPGGTPSRCNPITAPPECTSEAIEDPEFMK